MLRQASRGLSPRLQNLRRSGKEDLLLLPHSFRRRRASPQRVWLWCLLLLMGPGADELAAMCTVSKTPRVYQGEPIRLVYDRRLPPAVVAEGIEMWKGCPGYSTSFPALQTGEPGFRTVEARLLLMGKNDICGTLSGSHITLYRWTRTADRRFVNCGSLAENLAHEIGHVLGLRDASDDSLCDYYVMSRISRKNLGRRTVHGDECQAVSQLWMLQEESPVSASRERTQVEGR